MQNELAVARNAATVKSRELTEAREQARKYWDELRRERDAHAETHAETRDERQRQDRALGAVRELNSSLMTRINDLHREVARLGGWVDRVREIDLLRADLIRPGIRTGEDDPSVLD